MYDLIKIGSILVGEFVSAYNLSSKWFDPQRNPLRLPKRVSVETEAPSPSGVSNNPTTQQRIFGEILKPRKSCEILDDNTHEFRIDLFPKIPRRFRIFLPRLNNLFFFLPYVFFSKMRGNVGLPSYFQFFLNIPQTEVKNTPGVE